MDNRYVVVEMNESYARDISKWKYPSPYENYSFAGDEAEFREVMNGYHFAVLDSETSELSGFVAIGPSAQVRIPNKDSIYDDESFTDIAFGLRPDLCGMGLGLYLVNSAICFAKQQFPEDDIRITAENTNKRAVRLYAKMGFKKVCSFRRSLFGTKLIVMTKSV